MFSVVRQQVVAAPLAAAWRLLTEARLVSEWFADCRRLAPEAPFRFDFGDGDYFGGHVAEWEEPHHLGLRWRFMDAGPWFTIEYDLEPDGAQTIVTVRDTGAVTRREADGLGEGWADFLARLAERARTGLPSRYRWSPSIGAAAIAPAPLAETAARLRDERWWHAAFPAAQVRLAGGDAVRIVAEVQEPEWRGVVTTAVVDLFAHPAGTYVGIVHGGWEALPADTQVDERRRYATRWAALLQGIDAAVPRTAVVPVT